MTIRVHIDRLVLNEMPIARREGRLVQQAMEKELARLIAAGGLSPDIASGGAYPEVSARNISISGSNAQVIGKEIARAVYGGIGP
jgi:hypothetical protein